MSIYEAWSDPLDPRLKEDKQVNDIVAKIVALERRAARLEALCGSIITTIDVNFERGNLTSEHEAQLNWMLKRWREEFEQLRTKMEDIIR